MHPAVDKQVYVFSVLDRSVVEAVVHSDSPQWLAHQRSCPKLDGTLFIQSIICHRHVSIYLNSLFYLLDIPLIVLISHQTCRRPLWGEQHPVQLQGSRLPVQIQNKENPCSCGPPCTRPWSLQSPSGTCTCEEDPPAVSLLWVCIMVSAVAALKMSAVNFSRRRYFPAISAPPVIIPKDPPLPGPGQYDVGDYKGPLRKAMPTAAFASKAERLPLNSKADSGPGPGKGLLGCYFCGYVKDFRKHFFPALYKTDSRLFNL